MTPSELKHRRTQLGLTQVRLAAELGVTPLTVSAWERGTRKMGEPAARLVLLLGHSASSSQKKGRR
jgi:DNA-binding transcriptional regulator YiaG